MADPIVTDMNAWEIVRNVLTGVNATALLFAIRRLSRLELMVETMWRSFLGGGLFHRRHDDPPETEHSE